MNWAIYLYFIIVFAMTVSPDYRLTVVIVILGLAVLAVVSSIFRVRAWSIFATPNAERPRHSVPWCFLTCFAIILLGTVIYWLAWYPGGYNLDASGQWYQAHGMLPYNDWHPIFSTLLYQLCAWFCDDFRFCILIQVLSFSFACALLLSTLYQSGVPLKPVCATAMYIALNPAIGMNNVCMTKDVQFTVFIVLMTDIMLRVFFSDGKWFSDYRHCLYSAVIGTCICLVRHNGILFTLPLFVLLLTQYRARIKNILCTALVCIMLFAGIKDTLFRFLDVQPHDNPVGEAIGIPMGIMANALLYEPDHLPEEIHGLLNEIATDDEWREHYITGEWDSCKWIMPGVDKLKTVPLNQIIVYTLRTVAACPESSYESIRENTKIVWHPFQTLPYWVPYVYTEEDEFQIVSRPVPFFSEIASILIQLSMLPPISAFFWNTGMQIILLMLAFLLSPHKGYNSDAFLYIPLLVYDFGTMLLLAGPNQRYFYGNAVLFLPIILSVWYQRGDL